MVTPGRRHIGTSRMRESLWRLARIVPREFHASPPLETLALTLGFSHEELADSGVLDRVVSAQRRTDDIIDRATKTLEPLGITRAELDQFVSEQIKRRANKRPD